MDSPQGSIRDRAPPSLDRIPVVPLVASSRQAHLVSMPPQGSAKTSNRIKAHFLAGSKITSSQEPHCSVKIIIHLRLAKIPVALEVRALLSDKTTTQLEVSDRNPLSLEVSNSNLLHRLEVSSVARTISHRQVADFLVKITNKILVEVFSGVITNNRTLVVLAVNLSKTTRVDSLDP